MTHVPRAPAKTPAKGSAKAPINAPAETPAEALNWRNCWYPVAFLQDLPRDRPTGFTLYDEPLMLYFDGSGQPVCLQDRCPTVHRRVCPQCHWPGCPGRAESDWRVKITSSRTSRHTRKPGSQP